MSCGWQVGPLCLWEFGIARHKTLHGLRSRMLAAERLFVAAYFQTDSAKQKRVIIHSPIPDMFYFCDVLQIDLLYSYLFFMTGLLHFEYIA